MNRKPKISKNHKKEKKTSSVSDHVMTMRNLRVRKTKLNHKS